MWLLLSAVASAGVTVQSSGIVYPTLTDALAAAVPGDTLTLDAGIHPDLVTVSADVTLVGPGAVLTGCEESSIVVEQDVALTVVGLTFDSACRGIQLLGGNTFEALDTTFLGRSVYDGGAVKAREPVSLTFTGGAWRSSADHDGGGLYVTSTAPAPVTLTGVRLEGVAGEAYLGGSIFASGVDLDVSGCTFTGGSAGWGGGIWVESGTLSVSDSAFDGVVAANSGGGICFDEMVSVDVLRSTFCRASATVGVEGYGGAIAGAQVTGPVTIRNSTFIESSAQFGAALYAYDGTWTVDNVTVVGSTGTGAIYVEPDAVVDGSNSVVADSDDWGLYVAAGATVQSRLDDGLHWNNRPGDATGYASVSGTQADPGFVAWSQDQDCTNDVLWPVYGSPLLDGGDPTVLDPDGSVSDIGATGGPDADPALWADDDGDGGPNILDCDPADPTRFPGADEVCDGIDQDCDVTLDEQAVDAPEWWLDCDGDGQGGPDSIFLCAPIPGHPCAWSNVVGTDCDDADATTYAGAPELCAAGDQDCDGDDDAGAIDAATWYEDADADGYGGVAIVACLQPPGSAPTPGDCDDTNAGTWPGAPDLCGDGVDQDCNGTDGDDASLADWVRDADGDGWGDALAPIETSCADLSATHVPPELAQDCDDGDAARHPDAAEVCNGVDDDCDGGVDDVGPDRTWYPDADGDGFGADAGAVTGPCEPAGDWLETGGDCDDAQVAVRPDAVESCNGVDDDCDGAVDDVGPDHTWYPDADGDGFGADAGAVTGPCEPAGDWLETGGDCDDAQVAVRPDAVESCNGVDDDCDGAVDADDDDTVGLVDAWPDADGDGFGGCPDGECAPKAVCAADLGAGWDDAHSDCDDADPEVSPGADETVGNSVDEDCDGVVAQLAEEEKGCGCGHVRPAGVWVLAGALLGLRRRR